MNVFIFKTDIKTRWEVEKIKPFFNNEPSISRWVVDTEDVDHVLKIVASDESKESEMIRLVNEHGFYCEALPD